MKPTFFVGSTSIRLATVTLIVLLITTLVVGRDLLPQAGRLVTLFSIANALLAVIALLHCSRAVYSAWERFAVRFHKVLVTLLFGACYLSGPVFRVPNCPNNTLATPTKTSKQERRRMYLYGINIPSNIITLSGIAELMSSVHLSNTPNEPIGKRRPMSPRRMPALVILFTSAPPIHILYVVLSNQNQHIWVVYLRCLSMLICPDGERGAGDW